MLDDFLHSFTLLFVLLNPFLLVVYLLDLVNRLDAQTLVRVLLRAAIIAAVVFIAFAWSGDALFRNMLQARFAAFLLFGGVIFLLIALRYVLTGEGALLQLRGEPEHLAGSIAMPFLIGPGTVNASVLAGARLPIVWAAACILAALLCTVVCVFLLHTLHHWVKERNAALVERYVDIVGRISALVIGTIAVEMILQGIELWQAGP